MIRLRFPVYAGGSGVMRGSRSGPFDERFQLYFEETEWLIRAIRKNS